MQKQLCNDLESAMQMDQVLLWRMVQNCTSNLSPCCSTNDKTVSHRLNCANVEEAETNLYSTPALLYCKRVICCCVGLRRTWMHVQIVLQHSGNEICSHKIQHVVYHHTCLIHQVSGRLQRQYFSNGCLKKSVTQIQILISSRIVQPYHTHKHTHSCTSTMNIQRKNVRLH